MQVDQIWRYPVKSMGGERLEEASLTERGVQGDRLVQAYDAMGRLVTARRFPKLLRHRVTTNARGEPEVDGRPWDSEDVARDVAEDVRAGARLARSDASLRFDVLPLLVATDGSLAAFGYDSRRLRPNIVIAGVEGLAERSWEGRLIRVGEAVVGLDSLRGRCVMTTFDPDTNSQDPAVLQSIVDRFDGRLCLNAWVERPGRIRVGDPVELLPAAS
ncbi:MAG: MOSC N-terminal beta barrel domain-containing protein [Acidobacteria bacterium]|nr:MOSC N-terminal beta barrel domain-containing protein [Acidobacteriota bacterium]